MPSTMLLPQVSPLFQTPKRPRALSPEQVCEIRLAFQDGVPVRVLAERYGIAKSVAHRVATGQTYTDVVTRPKIAWFDPVVRFRGIHNDDELRAMASMLRSNPGKWALVKKNRAKPDGKRYESWGLEVSTIQLSPGEYGLFVRFPVPSFTRALAG